MNEVIVQGMILSVMPMGEYDRRVEILSSKFGRFSAFARGARKPGSSLVSATRVMAFGNFTLYQGKSSYTLRNAEILDYFDELTGDVERFYYGTYFLEVAQFFSRENVEASAMLKHVYYSLKALSRSSISRQLIRNIFELKMLDLNGLCPTTERISSGTGVYAFAGHMSMDCKRAYDHVLAFPVEKQYTFRLSESVEKEFEEIVRHLMMQNVDRQFKSLPLISDQAEKY